MWLSVRRMEKVKESQPLQLGCILTTALRGVGDWKLFAGDEKNLISIWKLMFNKSNEGTKSSKWSWFMWVLAGCRWLFACWGLSHSLTPAGVAQRQAGHPVSRGEFPIFRIRACILLKKINGVFLVLLYREIKHVLLQQWTEIWALKVLLFLSFHEQHQGKFAPSLKTNKFQVL